MPIWWDKFLVAVFGGTYGTEVAGDATDSAPNQNNEDIAMQSFRKRMSSGNIGFQHYQRAPGFDYVHWKPYGKRRRRYYLNEFPKQCRSLAPYVRDVAYAGYVGLEEKKWAGMGLEPAPLGTRRPGTNPSSLQGSRDILAKMGTVQ